MYKQRTQKQKIKDFIFFPIRALTLFEDDKWGLSALASERFDYVNKQVTGRCLDVGCGRNNRFIVEYRNEEGCGIDVYQYKGIDPKNILKDPTKFPFENNSFETITFIANINHIPRPLRDLELCEAFRCLSAGGTIIVTMGNPLAEVLVHKIVYLYDKFFGTNHDMDSERGMEEEEEYYLTNTEIINRLKKANFKNIKIHYFLTQWGLNHLFVANKE